MSAWLEAAHRIAATIALGVVISLYAAGVRAGSFDDGYQAYQRGEFAAARRIWRELAEAGEPRAQYNLGILYDEGRGVAVDREKARQWWRKAAAQDLPRALYNLATSYLFGVEAEDDHAEGLKFMSRAAMLGLMRSQYVLGKIYLHGLGVKVDEAKARRWAASRG